MMNREIKVLHITAHLGGGVGKALSGLVLNTPGDSLIRHSIACLEVPEKSHFIDKITGAGCDVFVSPSQGLLTDLIEHSDVVQLEWWNHPATINMLCSGPLPAMRLVLWCHVSGLHNPIIPCQLMEAAHKCLFTSPCSYASTEVSSLLPRCRENFAVVHSSGGFDGLIAPFRNPNDKLAAGYLGSLNFAKLHPNYVEFLAAVREPGFTVRMIGDITNKEILERQCRQAGRSELLAFRGYQSDIITELSSINVLIYLLNPMHYGTTENALLEAMAMGVVPIVLNNPAENILVEDRKTGLIVHSPQELADAIEWLTRNPAERVKIGMQAAQSVTGRFAVDRMVNSLTMHYRSVINTNKRLISFKEIFGKDPAEWFLSCQANAAVFTDKEALSEMDPLLVHSLFERTKGSIYHFQDYFHGNTQLSEWNDNITKYKSNLTENGMSGVQNEYI